MVESASQKTGRARRKGRAYALAALALAFLCAVPVHAEMRPFLRNARMMGMGGAYIGLADDENAVFLNPAGLAGVKEVTFYVGNLDMESSNDLIYSYRDSRDAFKSLNSDSLNAAMGKNLYGHATFTSVFQMPQFALGLIGDAQVALNAENRALPQVEVGFQATHGIQLGYGFSLRGKRRIRPGDADFRVGFAPKVLFRRGGYYLMSPVQLLQLDRGANALNETVGGYGMGVGLDLGTQYIQQVDKSWTVSAGLAYRDIGNTTFKSNRAAPITTDLGVGFAAQYNGGLVKINTAFDHTNLLDAADWRLRNHLGTEIKLPLFALYGGINQVYATYGVAFDLWAIKVTAVSYGHELGEMAFQDATRRYMLRMSLKLEF